MKTALKPYREALTHPADSFVLTSAPEKGRPLGFFGYAPSSLRSDSDIFICVHGLNRNAASQLFRFRPLAEETGVLLVAPIFSKAHFRHYQSLKPSPCGRKPDEELIHLMEELGDMFCLQAPAIKMFGYSGGGQFVHRFAMRHPSRVDRLMLSSPGWYTLPDASRNFPFGVASPPGEAPIDLDSFLRKPIDVVVGASDNERDNTLNQTPEIDSMQGRTRLERAKTFVAAVKNEASQRKIAAQITLHILKKGVHSFEQNMDHCGLGALVKRRLFPAVTDDLSAALLREYSCARQLARLWGCWRA